MAKRFALASFIVAVLGAAVAAFGPVVRSCVSAGGPERCVGKSSFEVDGAWVLVVVAVPVLLTLLPLLLWHRVTVVVSALLLWTLCVLGLASIGLFFVPAAVLLTVTAAMLDSQPALPG